MQLQLTQSAILKFLKCRKAYWFRYVTELVPDRPKPKNLIIGDAVHTILERYHNGSTIQNAITRKILAPLDADSKALVKGMMLGYEKRYSQQTFETVNTEQTFYHNVWYARKDQDLDIVFAGKKDAEIIELSSKKDALMEHKTARAVTQNYIAKLDTDFQCLFYLVFGMPHNVERVLYNVIEKAQFRQKQKESNKEFRERLIEEYQYNPARYFRFWLYFSLDKQREFYDEVKDVAYEIARCHKKEKFHRCRNSCFPYVGPPCEYQPLCFDITNEVIQKKYIHKQPFTELEEDDAEPTTKQTKNTVTNSQDTGQ